MASKSLQKWLDERSTALDELEAAHRSVGGTGRGRRYVTEQLNHAYAVLLSSQFQGFCRDLHSECADFIVLNSVHEVLRAVLRQAFTEGRKLDKGNANPGNVGSDFNRFGLVFWAYVQKENARCLEWKNRLDKLNEWRNAIAHQDFDMTKLGGSALRLKQVRAWRQACNGLARAFDEVMKGHLSSWFGCDPW